MTFNPPEMSPELIDLLSEAGIVDDAMALQLHQLRQAEMLRGTQQPGVTQVGNRIYAASPLAHVAATMAQVRGGQQESDVQQQLASLLRSKRGALRGGLDWTRQGYQQQTAPGYRQQATPSTPSAYPGVGLDPRYA